MKSVFTGIAVVSAVFTVLLILLQQKGVGLGSAFGGESFVYRARRGAERVIFFATIISAVSFVVSTFLIAEIL